MGYVLQAVYLCLSGGSLLETQLFSSYSLLELHQQLQQIINQFFTYSRLSDLPEIKSIAVFTVEDFLFQNSGRTIVLHNPKGAYSGFRYLVLRWGKKEDMMGRVINIDATELISYVAKSEVFLYDLIAMTHKTYTVEGASESSSKGSPVDSTTSIIEFLKDKIDFPDQNYAHRISWFFIRMVYREMAVRTLPEFKEICFQIKNYWEKKLAHGEAENFYNASVICNTLYTFRL